MTDNLTAVWARGGVTFGAWVTSMSDTTVEVLARAGYDYIGIDCQHTLLSESDAGHLLRPLLAAGSLRETRTTLGTPAASSGRSS